MPTLNINMVENENDSELKDARLTWNSKSFFLTGSSDLENWDYVSGGGGFSSAGPRVEHLQSQLPGLSGTMPSQATGSCNLT